MLDAQADHRFQLYPAGAIQVINSVPDRLPLFVGLFLGFSVEPNLSELPVGLLVLVVPAAASLPVIRLLHGALPMC